MAKPKRQKKLAGTFAASTTAPPRERWARGEVEALDRAIADEEGRPALPFRAIDTLTAMLRKGTITPAMHKAGNQFRDDFALAGLEPLRAADWGRVVGSGSSGRDHLSILQMDARQRVWEALVALGGMAAPAGCCAWHVLGREATLKEWATREGWGGRPISQETASGILVGALGVLQAHYGF